MTVSPNSLIAESLVGLGLGIALSPAAVYLHESGHALAGKLLWTGAKTEISMPRYGFFGHAECRFSNVETLSYLGEILGEENSRACRAAAGPLTDMIVSLAVLALSNSRLVATATLFPALAPICYSIGYLSADADAGSRGHDFANIAEWGGKGQYTAYSVAALAVATLAMCKAF